MPEAVSVRIDCPERSRRFGASAVTAARNVAAHSQGRRGCASIRGDECARIRRRGRINVGTVGEFTRERVALGFWPDRCAGGVGFRVFGLLD